MGARRPMSEPVKNHPRRRMTVASICVVMLSALTLAGCHDPDPVLLPPAGSATTTSQRASSPATVAPAAPLTDAAATSTTDVKRTTTTSMSASTNTGYTSPQTSEATTAYPTTSPATFTVAQPSIAPAVESSPSTTARPSTTSTATTATSRPTTTTTGDPPWCTVEVINYPPQSKPTGRGGARAAVRHDIVIRSNQPLRTTEEATWIYYPGTNPGRQPSDRTGKGASSFSIGAGPRLDSGGNAVATIWTEDYPFQSARSGGYYQLWFMIEGRLNGNPGGVPPDCQGSWEELPEGSTPPVTMDTTSTTAYSGPPDGPAVTPPTTTSRAS